MREVVVDEKLGKKRETKKMKKRDEWIDLFSQKSEEVSQWREERPKATFNEIEAEVDKQLASVRTKMLQELVLESKLQNLSQLSEEERPTCPHCGKPMAANGQQKRRLMTAHNQEVELERSKGYCRRCKISLFPPG